MIRRLLIANRGEIARRIIRACRELGMESVAVYSDADARAPHVHAADRAEHLGPSPPADSYLHVGRILDAARRAQADAVHPGYGFLSERAAFAQACHDAGLIFVGPPAGALEHMGSKIGARRLMEKAGVPVVPGAAPADQSDAALVAAVDQVGLPVMLKPSAGGGGIGMKVVRERDAVMDAVQRARREAQAAFADGSLYVERFVERPRHIEIQIFADAHGNAVHLFERECSIQRRHQKMIEESPSPGLSPGVRARMGRAAVTAARAVGYVNAGTVEFLVAGSGDDARFFFLEMNTRLQVEHPITEAVVGVDLVRAQLLVAGGEPLPWRQDDLSQRGHAFECRIYAEDPAAGFLPQAGTLLVYREPGGPNVRVDAGVVEGSEISVFYDPLIAKLIVAAETRPAALQRARAALGQFVVLGVHTNIPLLTALLTHSAVVAGDVHTGFLESETDALLASLPSTLPDAALAAVAFHNQAATAASSPRAGPAPDVDPFDALHGWGR